MKKGYTTIGVLVILGVVLALGTLFVISDGNATGYAGSPSGAITAFVPQDTPCSSDADCVLPDTCQYYPGYGGYYCGNGCGSVSCDTNSDCVGEFKSECCDNEDSGACVEGSCTCIEPCKEGSFCDTSPSEGETQCGGAFGFSPAPSPCLPNNPIGPFSTGVGVTSGQNQGACDCNKDGCTEGAQCAVFGVSTNGDSFPNPCGPNGHCIPTDSEDGFLIGQCACGKKPCELLDAEGFQGEFEQCPDTVQCDKDATCNSHDDCGGVGPGRCVDGICDCECVSWAPCDPGENFDDNLNIACGTYGEGGFYGRCIVGPDGVGECMCTDDLGCSPIDCIAGVTPCSGDNFDCGDDGEDNCSEGICEACGEDCELPCSSEGCSDGLTQEECDIVAQELGSTAGCTVDTEENDCDCPDIPTEMCSACYSLPDGLVGSCG